ncbi:transposable element Tcb1 transposase [Trichonephila clavipes]|nr:transposable element Tcb1 transposase [Trichonephila clavipes]
MAFTQGNSRHHLHVHDDKKPHVCHMCSKDFSRNAISFSSSIRVRQWTLTYRVSGLSFREIGSRVGRTQATVMGICEHWMQEDTKDRCGRLHPPQCTTLCEDRQIVRMAVTDRSVTS